jgi:hypothetical protein
MAHLIRSTGRMAVFLASVGTVLAVAPRASSAQSGIVVQGFSEPPPLPGGLTYTKVAVGWAHYLAMRSDGSVVAWGNNSHGDCVVPTLPPGLRYVAIGAGCSHSLAVRSDGSLVAWGWNAYGQCDVPSLPNGLTYVDVEGSVGQSLAIRSDGSVVGWGSNQWNENIIPPLPPGLRYVEVAGNGEFPGWPDEFCLARRSDGTLIAWGNCFWGQCAIPSLPPGVVYVQIGTGAYHAVARRSDGVVVAWGDNSYGQCDVPPLPNGLTYVDVAAGGDYNVALRSDGAVIPWGDNFWGIRYLPQLPSGVAYVDVDALGLGRYAGCPTCELPFCLGDGSSASVPCPCANSGSGGRGCENSASTGGTQLTVHGEVHPDRVVLSTTGEVPTSLSIFFQGRSVLESPATFGDGVRCIGGALKRIGVKTAVAGAASYPGTGDPTISARSAALGDLIRPGTYRYYQVSYRDPDPAFCNSATFNASNAVMVAW